jgi:hypothetical protein
MTAPMATQVTAQHTAGERTVATNRSKVRGTPAARHGPQPGP